MTDLVVHALDAAELEHLRTFQQRSRIYLAISPHPTNSIEYVMRVNGVPASFDSVFEIDYDRDGLPAGDAAAFANCLRDMSVWIGTTSGARDVGVVRLRGFSGGSNETAGTMLVGEMSEIEFSDNDYLTVMDDYRLWPRHIYIDGAGVIYMDRDIAYTDEHQYPDPVPVLGPDAVVYYDGTLGGANTVDVDFDGSDRWALYGGI